MNHLIEIVMMLLKKGEEKRLHFYLKLKLLSTSYDV